MRAFGLILLALVVAIQWPLWFGHGGWMRVRTVLHQLEAQQSINATLRAKNQALSAEIASLREGSEAIEERARGELRMMRSDEIFFQLKPGASHTATAVPAAPTEEKSGAKPDDTAALPPGKPELH